MPNRFPPGMDVMEVKSDLIARRIYDILENARTFRVTRKVELEERGRTEKVNVQMARGIIHGKPFFTAVTMTDERSEKAEVIYDGEAEMVRGAVPHMVSLVSETRRRMRRIGGFEEVIDFFNGTLHNDSDVELVNNVLTRVEKIVTLANPDISRIVLRRTGTK